jgi:hypothetical protein
MEKVMPEKSRLFGAAATIPSDTPRAISSRELWSPDKAADYVGLAKPTLSKWRCLKTGQIYYKIGGRIFYTKEDLDAFIAGSRVDGTAVAA